MFSRWASRRREFQAEKMVHGNKHYKGWVKGRTLEKGVSYFQLSLWELENCWEEVRNPIGNRDPLFKNNVLSILFLNFHPKLERKLLYFVKTKTKPDRRLWTLHIAQLIRGYIEIGGSDILEYHPNHCLSFETILVFTQSFLEASKFSKINK